MALRAMRLALGLAKPKINVLFLGLDGAGKSSVLNALKPEGERARTTPPTSAPLTERVVVRTKHGSHKLKAVDLPGGQEAATTLWPQHFAGAQAVVWVVDASDALRTQAAQDALDRAVSHPDLAGVPLLVLVNKMHAPGALTQQQVEEALELERMPGGAREWHVCACSAATGEGVQAGCEWLVAAVARAPARLHAPAAQQAQ